MRRVAFGAAFVGGALLVVRALAPRVHARLLATCERMFEELPETFPPKRMLRGIEEISANSARTLALLEERTQAREPDLLQTAFSNKEDRRSRRPVGVS